MTETEDPSVQHSSSEIRHSDDEPRFSWLSRLLWPFTSWLVTNITVTLFWFYLFVLNRTTVIGRSNVGTESNTLLLSNHQSMIDSFLVGLAAYYPRSWFQPRLIPWNPAALENFYKNPLLAWLSFNWKCIPVRRGRRDLRALKRMSEELKHGVMTLFPEGTRTRDGSVGKGRPGAGLLILSNRPRAIPVAIEGMNRVLPIGRFIPRIGKRVYVYYGEPLDLSDYEAGDRSKQPSQAVLVRVMSAIRKQHRELQILAGTAANNAQQQELPMVSSENAKDELITQ